MSECADAAPGLIGSIVNESMSETSVVVGGSVSLLRRLYGVVSFLGGNFTGMYSGAKAVYKVHKSELLEECTILGPAAVPVYDAEKEPEMKGTWEGSETFGEALAIVLLSQPGKVLVVPRRKLTVHTLSPSLLKKLSDFLSTKIESAKLVSLFESIVAINDIDSRPQPLPKMQAAEVEVVYESTHPYDNSQDSYKDIKMEGATEMTISFDPRSATENGKKIFKQCKKTQPRLFFQILNTHIYKYTHILTH